jgi:hypothetical protein
MTDHAPQVFKDAIKLVALMQAVLEQMDTLKGTKLYKQKIKKQMNLLEQSIESTLLEPLKRLDSTNDELFTRILNNVEMILEMDADDLAQLKIVLDDEHDNG